ncbi:MAG TPA: transporter [Streptomyces sp.]|uniref:transporter n=1 Tax=Streptomyces sp. TaxID=1931 RepID=UPI002C196E92|nr:transporter [Streptomyces sp.]HWU12292.1 transporter [Streptomyces sp.]
MRRASRRGDITAALLLLVTDGMLLGVLLFGVLVSGGLTGSPDRAAAGREASRAALVCLAVLLVSGGIATAVRAWVTAVAQVIVLGGAAALAWTAFGP